MVLNVVNKILLLCVFLDKFVNSIIDSMATLKILIEEVVKHPAGTRKVVDRSSLEFNDSIIFPFQQIVDSYKIVHPTKQLVFTFTLL